MVRCWIEGDGSMLGPIIGSFVGFKTGNWMPKTNLAGMKKHKFGESKFFSGNELAPRQNIF
jgi:hypothetical protein